MQRQASVGTGASSNYGWVILVACFVSYGFAFGLMYSFGVFLKPLQDDLGWTRDMVSWVPSLYMLFLCLSGPIVGWLADRYGPRAVVIPGAALIGLGMVLASRVTTPWHLYIFYSLFVGVGCSAIGNALMPTVVRWFPKRMSLVAATVACGAFVGTMAMAPLVTRAISAWGWRTSSVVLGCFAVVLMAMALFVKRAPAPQATPGAAQNTPQMEGLTLGQAVRTRSLWALFILFVLAYIGAMMVQYHLTPHATDIGLSKEVAANLLVVISAVGIAGKLLGGAAADRLGRRAFVAFAMLLQGATLAMLPRAGSETSLYAFAAVWGLGYGIWAPQLVSVVGETFGLRNAASIMGLVGMSFGVGGTVGPTLAGKVFSSGGSYSPAFYLGAATMVLASVMMVLLVKPVKVPAPGPARERKAGALPERA